MFDDAQYSPAVPVARVRRSDGIPRPRWELLRGKRLGDCWEKRLLDPGGGVEKCSGRLPWDRAGWPQPHKHAFFLKFELPHIEASTLA